MTEKEITAAIVDLFPSLAHWDKGIEMFVWSEGRDEEIREFSPCTDPLAALAVEKLVQGTTAGVFYPRHLVRVVRSTAKLPLTEELGLSDAYWVIMSNPHQKAEAILRTYGKWVDPIDNSPPSTSRFVVSIDDGFVEYSYPWDLSSDYSIEEICQSLTKALGRPPSTAGSIRPPAPN